MIWALITIICPVHQEYEKDVSFGLPETASTEELGGFCGDKAEHGWGEDLEPRAGNTRDKAMEPGMAGLDKLRKKEMQWSSTWLKIKPFSAAGDRAGLSGGSWGVFAVIDLAAALSCAPARAHLCALKAALTESSTFMKTHTATLIINSRGGNSGNV